MLGRRLAAITAVLAVSALWPTTATSHGASVPADGAADAGCLSCHTGIEDIHPGFQLTCVDCHGGDGQSRDKATAHVQPTRPLPTDERVLPIDWDLPYQRFLNPSNLRVAAVACSPCHDDLVQHVHKSLHGTTAGHLGDGYYEHGLSREREPAFSVFPVRDEDGRSAPHAVRTTRQVPAFDRSARPDRIATHYADLPRKACMQCHLWSEGRAVDGRLGLDGDYRGEGCAACHVTYADDGRSRSRDRSIDKLEPGHPIAHRFTTKIPTDTCTRCHYGDATIGLHFRGLAQLVPGMPAGPDVPGTTDTLQNGVFYIRDPDLTPPDVHHEKGMHCIDCHTATDAMGDGDIHPNMDHAVEIECESCHGSIDRVSDLMTSHGRRVKNLFRLGDDVSLVSKVTGKRHPVTQVKHLVDPEHPRYSARAAAAMTKDHGRLECYTCHNGWNANFFGFHFDRNEQFTQLDLLSGERTPGRVTTQEKVFATFNQLRLGFNHEARIAPWIVGFSTVGSAHGQDGQTLLRQEPPVTAAGLSGVTMIPHQMHTTRGEARACTDCHSASAVYGTGTTNFRMTRELGFAITRRGFWSLGIDARTPAQTRPLARVDVAGVPRAVALAMDEVRGRATHAFVATASGDLVVLDVAAPTNPTEVARRKLVQDPRRLLSAGRHLFVADGVAGVAIFDVERRNQPRPVANFPTVEARGLALAWPWLLVADGPGGLVILEVSQPDRPRLVTEVDLNFESAQPNDAFDVAVLFQASRTRRGQNGRLQRTPPRHLAVVACGLDGARIVDFTDPAQPKVLHEVSGTPALTFARGDVRGVALNTVFDLGTAGGGERSREHDYVYLLAEEGPDDNRQQRVRVVDISDPMRPRPTREGNPRVYGAAGRLALLRTYNAPFLTHFVLAVGAGGLGTMVDVSKMTSTGASVAAVWTGVDGVVDLALEEFAHDRLCDEDGKPVKDVSHDDCRYLTPAEQLTVLRAQLRPQPERQPRVGGGR